MALFRHMLGQQELEHGGKTTDSGLGQAQLHTRHARAIRGDNDQLRGTQRSRRTATMRGEEVSAGNAPKLQWAFPAMPGVPSCSSLFVRHDNRGD